MQKLILVTMGFWMSLLGCAQETKYATQGNAEFAKTIAIPSVQLVDVRTPGEYAQGHISGAMNIDVQASDFGVRAVKLNKEHPVAVYCRSGMRSRTAAAKLAEQGYEVYNLDGGIMRWDGPKTR